MAKKNANGGNSKKPTLTHEELEYIRQHARSLSIAVDGQTKLLPPKQFSTGSQGWYNNEKAIIKVGDREVRVQCNIQITVIGSKELAGAGGRAAAGESED